MYTITQVSNLFGKAKETIRVWSREFSQWLSPHATPAKKGVRKFTDGDLSVFAYVAEQRDLGKKFDDIKVDLENGSRGLVPVEELVRADDTPQKIILQLQATVKHYEERVHDLETENAIIKGREQVYQEQLDRAHERIAELNQQIGQLKAKD